MFKKKKGAIADEGVALIIMIALGVIVVVVLYIIGGVITGSMYQASEADLLAMGPHDGNISNATLVKNHILAGTANTFETYEASAGYTKITILAVIGIGIISLMVAGFGLGKMTGGSGGATL
jgi:hypothetical protein